MKKMSDETRNKIRLSKLGIKRPNMTGPLNPNFGKNMTGIHNPSWKGGAEAKRIRYKEKHPYKLPFDGIKKRSKILGYPQVISNADFQKWFYGTPDVCDYCGRPVKVRSGNRMESLSIDRINNEKPYSLDNICKSCNRCNTVKGRFFTYDQMKEIAAKYFTTV